MPDQFYKLMFALGGVNDRTVQACIEEAQMRLALHIDIWFTIFIAEQNFNNRKNYLENEAVNIFFDNLIGIHDAL